MEFFIFIALLIIIILLFTIKGQQKATAKDTLQNIASLKKELLELKETIHKFPAKNEAPIRPTDESVVQWRPYVPPEILKPPIAPEPVEMIPAADAEPAIPDAAVIADEEDTIHMNTAAPPYLASEPAEGWWNKWLRNNPDLEKFIGENLINKIGIAVLVLGIAFFVKYAIDQNWIKEAGRVSIGIGCGIVLIGLAHFLRNSYRSFSSVLAGGGLAVFYFTIAFAFHQYQMFSQTAAFLIMVVITLFAVVLALLYDKLELAVIAAIGGFITPFLLSTGTGNYVILFTYLVILNMGMLALAYFKKWQAINVIAFFFTLVIYGGWLANSTLSQNEFPFYKNSLLFASVFYALFMGMGLVYNVRKQRIFKALDFSLLMLTTFGYYAAGLTNLHYWDNGAYQGLFTIAVGIVNLGLAGFFYKTSKGDKNLLYLLIGLTLTFISLAAPVQLHGHTITLFWSAEFVLIYWLHQRSGITIFKYSSFIVVLLMLVSLLMDWVKANDFNDTHLTVIYRGLQGFITNMVAVAAFAILGVLIRKERNTIVYIAGLKNNIAGTAMIMMASVVFYLTCIFGVNLYFYHSQRLDVPNAWHQLISYVFTTLLLFIIRRYRLGVNAVWQVLLIAAGVVMYLLSIPLATGLRNGILQNQYSIAEFCIHWLAAAFLLYLLYQAIVIYRKNIPSFVPSGNSFVWLMNIVLVVFLAWNACTLIFLLLPAYKTLTSHCNNIQKQG